MKYNFIVDENIFYCAIRGVDEHDIDDDSSEKFLGLLQKNCHKIYLDIFFNRRYERNIQKRLEGLLRETHLKLDDKAVSLIRNIFHTKEKIIREFTEPSQFPEEETIPRKDLYIVRCANHFSAKIVTLDRGFRDAVNAHAFLKQNGIDR
ncbi:hypothetical protein ig2599ANME_0028 [groundwater metagenome]